jgi:hypothetical protein
MRLSLSAYSLVGALAILEPWQLSWGRRLADERLSVNAPTKIGILN